MTFLTKRTRDLPPPPLPQYSRNDLSIKWHSGVDLSWGKAFWAKNIEIFSREGDMSGNFTNNPVLGKVLPVIRDQEVNPASNMYVHITYFSTFYGDHILPFLHRFLNVLCVWCTYSNETVSCLKPDSQTCAPPPTHHAPPPAIMCMQLLSYNFPQILGSVRQEPDIFPFLKRNSFLLIGHRARHPHEPEKLCED